jgi:DNA replication ATP-dependent helicase/nuclease Dna2
MSLNKPELARLFYRELLKIHGNDGWPEATKASALARLLELLFLEVTKAENISFTTLFARIAYACHKFEVEKKTQYWIHFFRKKLRTLAPGGEAGQVYQLGLKTTAGAIAAVFGEAPPEELAAILPEKHLFVYNEIKISGFKPSARVIALQDDEANDRLIAQDADAPAEIIYVQYNIAERNEPFNPTIREIRNTFGFPITLSLTDVEVVHASSAPETRNEEPLTGHDVDKPSLRVTKGGRPRNPDPETRNPKPTPTYRPRAIVVEPDYLLDVSTVANCFQGSGAEPVVYLLQKFLPVEPSLPMMVGNIANFFLDELMNNPRATFKETFPKVFKLNPLAFSLLPDAAIREVMNTSQKHWVTLYNMVAQGFDKFDIEPSECYLEPSFYDEKHGLQGRLDVFYKKGNKSAIIELKSGSAFMPNRNGIGASHYIQTLLYDLMVRATFGGDVEPACYILYSKMDSRQLKFAPRIKSEQNEALQLRNQLVSLDRQIAAIQGQVNKAPVLERITINRFPHLKGFHRRDVELFEKTYTGLNDLERRYFNAFAGFIAREHQLAKTGIQGIDNANGLAALWLDDLAEKEENFQIIKSLKIRENRAYEDEALLIFEKTPETNQLANFRTGDIAVLYAAPSRPPPKGEEREGTSSPFGGGREGAWVNAQIFKVTILSITPEEVTVRLRYKQFNLQIFGEYDLWNLEHDQMDMSFNAMYQGLFQFAQTTEKKRELLLTVAAPSRPASPLPASSLTGRGGREGATEEQQRILEKMLSAQNYFLLWGPPGTGKTSLMLKHYAKWIFENTEENLLLLAYTNRAVDEICVALEDLGLDVSQSYLRIGSAYATGERFVPKLLREKTANITRRAELKEVFEKHRIVVSTLASLSGNMAVLKLKKFRRVVIDEASQILEPALVGLLPQFEQFILIGDHKQLPAVVVQDATASAVSDEQLQSTGLHNLRNSLFERLYHRCIGQGWHWAYDQLCHQGRMHEDIMRFPRDQFYEGNLLILPENIAMAARQTAALPVHGTAFQHDWEARIATRRLVFIPTGIDVESLSRKTNRHEAELIVKVVSWFQNRPGQHLNSQSIGIITPYRAQIALIREFLQKGKTDCKNLTVDTVERYQGSARDIILISLCTNAASQLDSLVSLSDDGVDRKLNVALTRARDHLVILGNETLLAANEGYRKLMEHCRQIQI